MAAGPEVLHEDMKEKLTCVICLELYKDPGTLDCGHSFCLPCLEGHWNIEEHAVNSAGDFTCPTCRKRYQERPRLRRSVALQNLVEDVQRAAAGSRISSCQAVGARCARHGRLLELYCLTDQRCICCECTVRECRDHPRALAGDERHTREEVLKDRLLKNESHLKRTETEMLQLEAQMTTLKDTADRSIMGISVRFDQLQKAFEACRALALQSIEREMAVALEQANENRAQLQSRRDALGQYRQQVEELCQQADDVIFLEGCSCLPSSGSSGSLPSVVFDVSGKVEAVTRILSEVSRLIQKELPNALHPMEASTEIQGSPKPPAVLKPEPSLVPRSELRTQLLQSYRNLTFDPNTAHKYIQLSKKNLKAKHMTSVSTPYPEHPERFESWQVLCAESFGEGRHYWEVKISGCFVYLGVAYRDIERKKKGKKAYIGHNGSSWSLQVQENCHSAWANGEEWKVPAPLYTHIGVHLDFSASTLSFYGIKDKMELLHTFHWVFSAPLYPAFWIGEEVDVTLCHLP
ncbi:tripartite motif-containing protein 65 [Rhinatrema bivittatum]|uniref:tripartite motif-containing protein 65 n=1 Tax=Rhinatrema bivittatum TaxID=194408 RepID=UPI001125FE6C|nr:tripartite motif-containing protein 65 [Rhinatrema bivittatum]